MIAMLESAVLEHARRHPYAYYRVLRWLPPLGPMGPQQYWLVSRFADVEQVLTNPDEFSSTVMAPADPVLLGADPPTHTSARRALSVALSKSGTSTLEPFIRTTAERLLEGVAGRAT